MYSQKNRIIRKKKYYNKTSYAINSNKIWTTNEVSLILNNTKTDHEISLIIGRSVAAIQAKRNRLNILTISKATQKNQNIDKLSKLRCRKRTRAAIIRGILKRESCSRCKNELGQAHHKDYNNHLDVEWLCEKCHKIIHKKEQEQLGTN